MMITAKSQRVHKVLDPDYIPMVALALSSFDFSSSIVYVLLFRSGLSLYRRRHDNIRFDMKDGLEDRLLFPIHLGVHWTIAAALMKEKKVIYLDSMGGQNEECRELILEYLRVEHEGNCKYCR